MRILFPMLVSIGLLVSNFSFAQTENKISLDIKNKPLATILKEIEKKGAVKFSYNPRSIQAERKINFKISEKTVSETLEALSQLVNIQYTYLENQIILSRNDPTENKVEQNLQSVTFSGYIKDTKSGEALIGATLYIKQLQSGTIANSYGFYSITVPSGVYDISVSYIGFKTVQKNITLNTNTRQDISLEEELPLLEEVTVIGTPEETIEETGVGTLQLKPKSIEERPALFGENDVVKSLESVPGIKIHSDGSTFYYVRGGNRDQNMILIDDSPIYNPSHLLGLFSTIIPDAATDITLYKGNMPANFGGRLSSVLDVHTRKGNDKDTQLWGNLSLISTKLGVEGPLKKEVSSFLLSGRFSRLKWLFQLVDNNLSKFSFHDLTGKVNTRLNANNHAYFSFYSGADNYFTANSGISWANKATTFRWTNQRSDKLFINTTLSASNYDYFLHINVAEGQRWNSHISNLNIKTDFSYFPKPENQISFGAGLNGYNFNPGNLSKNNRPNTEVSVRHSLEFVLYGNQDIKLTDHLAINYGLRLSTWTNFGESFELIYNQDHVATDTLTFRDGESYLTYLRAEPRATIQYLISPYSRIKLGYARNVQNVHLISNSISPFTSLEVWLPSNFTIKPQLSDQVTLGYHHALRKHNIALSAEVFYKYMQHQIDFETHAETLLNTFFESELRFGDATAYGLELLAKKDEGRLRGMAGYTLSRAFRKFPELNQGKDYRANFDRPHQINLSLSYDLSKRWTIGANWNFLTGAPYSAPISFYEYNGLEVPIYGQKNNARLPDYHRLDVTASIRLNKNRESKFNHDLTLSIFNFYSRKNSLFVNYNKQQLGERDFKVPVNLSDSEYAISQFYLFQFTPSLSYNFRWK